MPRLDFEKQFAKQLKNREVMPSEDSWEKLQGRLEKKEKKGPKYWWIGIAATIVGAILIFSFLQTDPVVDSTPVIVDTNPEKIESKIKEEENTGIVRNEKSTRKVGNESPYNPGVEEETSSPGKAAIAEANTRMGEGPEKVEDAEDRVFTGSLVPNPALAEAVGEPEMIDPEIDALLQAALVEVSAEDPGTLEVTDEQITALLAKARQEVRKERRLYQTASVTAEDLLQEVETELEHSFREQVFELIKDGLRKTRTAVANRNN